jgi:dipeptidyl aminopeptidase/acylaminoacyl peptidase
VNKLADRWESDLWIVNTDGTKNRFLVKGSRPQWSPDGKRIAYLAEGEPKGNQIFVLWLDTGKPTQVTHVVKPPGNLSWSPDGHSLAFTMRTPETEEWEIDMPDEPKGAKWTVKPRIVEGVYFRQDGRGFMKEGYLHLFTVPSDGGTPRQLTSGKWNVGARTMGLDFGATLDWTPDGKSIVFDGLNDTQDSQLYRRSHIYRVHVESGELEQITATKGPWTGPVVSPDGNLIAFTGYPWVAQTYRTEDLWIIGIDGSDLRIVGKLDRDPEQLHWAPDGGGVYFSAGDRGARNIYYASLEDQSVKKLTEGHHVLSLSSLAKNGTAAGVLSSPSEPGDVVRFKLPEGGPIEPITRVNLDILSQRQLGESEEIWYESEDNTRIQGWVIRPPDFDSIQKYPLILHIHGGPHSMYTVSFDFSFQNLAANGYLVLYTNPRGSTGYGTDFGNAIDNSYPSVDYEDLMAGVDELLSRGYVDPQRLFVTGVSGGGVLSSWTIGHTDRFAAAAVRAPVINWISFAGTTDITEWGYHRYSGYPWEDPQHWLEHSPLMYVDQVKTPTLLMTGELDLRTPMGQTEEYFQALNSLGVPTKLIRFNEEYHGTGSKPSNFMRTQLYLMDWFEQHSVSDAETQ